MFLGERLVGGVTHTQAAKVERGRRCGLRQQSHGDASGVGWIISHGRVIHAQSGNWLSGQQQKSKLDDAVLAGNRHAANRQRIITRVAEHARQLELHRDGLMQVHEKLSHPCIRHRDRAYVGERIERLRQGVRPVVCRPAVLQKETLRSPAAPVVRLTLRSDLCQFPLAARKSRKCQNSARATYTEAP